SSLDRIRTAHPRDPRPTTGTACRNNSRTGRGAEQIVGIRLIGNDVRSVGMNGRINKKETHELERDWASNPRWHGIRRPYGAAEMLRLRGSLRIEHTFARLGAERLWHLLETRDFVRALGALTGNQAVQQVSAGLEAIYLSGWQVAADANLAGETYPDQSLYPAN